ncbi:MAG TPA: hypothetical protein VIC33_16225 [Vicinamibacterales bacterium]|jgi:hypothetical protein
MPTGLKLLGALALMLAVACAGTAWRIHHHPAPSIEQLLPGYTKAQQRQMGILYGKGGVVLSNWVEELMDPEVEARIGAIAALLFAFGCFYIAHLLELPEPLDDHSP